MKKSILSIVAIGLCSTYMVALSAPYAAVAKSFYKNQVLESHIDANLIGSHDVCITNTTDHVTNFTIIYGLCVEGRKIGEHIACSQQFTVVRTLSPGQNYSEHFNSIFNVSLSGSYVFPVCANTRIIGEFNAYDEHCGQVQFPWGRK